jgi:flagellar hook assembly protein FlgD
MQNYPNPFNPRTTIRFAVPEYSKVKIVIYNSLGQKIRTLTDRDYAPGYHQIVWNGLDDLGVRVSSGVYFYQMSNEGTFSQSRKLVLMK